MFTQTHANEAHFNFDVRVLNRNSSMSIVGPMVLIIIIRKVHGWLRRTSTVSSRMDIHRGCGREHDKVGNHTRNLTSTRSVM